MTAKPKDQRIYRPFGLSIAIFAAAVIYGILPLAEVYVLWRMNAAATDAYLIAGVEITTWKALQGLLGGVMLITCLLAWWGRPPQIRFVLVGLLLLLTSANLYRIVETWITPADPIFGGQTQAAIRDFLRCQLPIMILVPLYVVWYINRAPARAFYRRVPLSALTRTIEPTDSDRQRTVEKINES
ncbi:MAG: hypothetical protein HY866_15070 [Chloroflexi bacterium]|nr:hypothetical protein [Chloroflexota bacterium]